jgi:glycerophosphoryl diester phosphodiesterase
MKAPTIKSYLRAHGRWIGLRFGYRGLLSCILFASAAIYGAEKPPLPAQGLCAHRGAAGTYPENTIPALEAAVRLGAQMIEFDLALTRDGELVLMHDATVNRTTNGTGRVLDLDLATLRQLDAGAWKHARFTGTRIPTFTEALAVLPYNVWLNVDLKADARWGPHSADVGRRVAEMIVAAGRQHQTLLAARADIAAAALKAAPEILICSMDRKPDSADYVQDAITRRVAYIQLRDCATDPRFPTWIAALKSAGVKINYFYSNEPAEVARLLAAGVDFVLVDHLEAVIAAQPSGRATVRPAPNK